MKKVLFSILFLASGLLSSDLIGQCDSENYSSACIPKLATGFNFLKSYKVDGEGGAKNKIEYSYVFTKGTQYMINLCTGGQTPDGVVVDLYDSNRNKVASSKINNQNVSAVVFPCNAVGIYYIQYTFDKSTAFCAGSALGFKR